MQQFTHFLGVDISKSKIDVALMDLNAKLIASFELINTPEAICKGFTELAKAHHFSLSTALVCMEATGLYSLPLTKAASQIKLVLYIEPAWKMKSSLHYRGKSDKTDAIRIADFARNSHHSLRPWKPQDQRLQRLNHLLTMRDSLITCKKKLVVPKNEAKVMGDTQQAKIRKQYSDPVVKQLLKQIKKIETEIEELIDAEPDLKQSRDLLQSIKGFGPITSLLLLILSHNFERFDGPRQMACFCGVAPFEWSSGSSIRGRTRISNKANKRLKKALHLAALSAIQHNPDINKYYERKVAEGKHKMAVINAVRNKLLHLAFAVIKRGTPYVV